VAMVVVAVASHPLLSGGRQGRDVCLVVRVSEPRMLKLYSRLRVNFASQAGVRP
jgi:hypothetical protein